MRFDREYLDNLTLMELLGYLIPDDTRLPKSQIIAKAMYDFVLKKFQNCTEAEKRDIIRSDPEFMYMLKALVMKRCGFKNEIDAFGKQIETPPVPEIKRGNELLWSEKGDPKPHPELRDEGARRVFEFTKCVDEGVKIAICEYFPHEYKKAYSEETGEVRINWKDTDKITELKNAKTPLELAQKLLPLLLDMHSSWMAEHCSMKPKQIMELRNVVSKVVLETIEKYQVEKMGIES